MKIFFLRIIMFVTVVLFAEQSFARNYIRIVGSSTVYPFAALIAENFVGIYPGSYSVVEANGTGGGFNQFCSGICFNYPDINNASRDITLSEVALCNKNGISNPLKITLGYDGIVIIYPKKLGKINLTSKELFLALASNVPSKENPKKWVPNFYKRWNEINTDLPDLPINIMGPPNTSGTRASFTELALENICDKIVNYKLTTTEKKMYCSNIRSDGAWLDGTENYSLVIQKVSQSNKLFAIAGYNYYKMNATKVLAIEINHVNPNLSTISDNTYVLSRPLFMYVKKEHLNNIPYFKHFVAELVNFNAVGPQGYLVQAGLIPLSKENFNKIFNQVNSVLYKK